MFLTDLLLFEYTDSGCAERPVLDINTEISSSAFGVGAGLFLLDIHISFVYNPLAEAVPRLSGVGIEPHTCWIRSAASLGFHGCPAARGTHCWARLYMAEKFQYHNHLNPSFTAHSNRKWP